MRIGYVRCSTAEQNETRQLRMMEEQKVEKIFIDKNDQIFVFLYNAAVSVERIQKCVLFL